jgi:hypothetical protein
VMSASMDSRLRGNDGRAGIGMVVVEVGAGKCVSTPNLLRQIGASPTFADGCKLMD